MKADLFAKDAFNSKHAIICGGAGDIGIQIAKEFAKAGISKLALFDNNVEQLEAIANELQSLGTEVLAITVDLSDSNATEQAIQDLYQIEPQWDILVTTAGLYIGGPFTEFNMDDWDRLMQINARAVFVVSRLVAKHMIAQGHGKIVHIGSSSTYFGTPGSGCYAASKVVINQLTQTMAVEWGEHNIQVNTICPTVTETKFLGFVEGDELHEKFRNKLKQKIPLKRLLIPEDIAPAVLFLASDAAQFINGAIIPIDGGSKLVST